MNKNTEDFFDKLNEHSQAKLTLLREYAIPWMRKVTLGTPSRKCAIIDTFAGAGLYEDGSKGSPIILVEEAIDYYNQSLENKNINFEEIILIFVEKDITTFSKLKCNLEEYLNQRLEPEKSNFLTLAPKVNVMISNTSFNRFTNTLLEKVDNIIPTLMFIDPFGYKVLNLNDICQIITKYEGCELLINFMYEEINRFFLKEDSETFKDTLKNFYGKNYEEIKTKISSKKPKERREIIIDGYKQNLYEAGAKYLLDFDIEKKGKVKMNIIFATKNIYGFDTMKESMYKVSNNVDFEYHTKTDQINLFDTKEYTEAEIIDELSQYIYSRFLGKRITFRIVKEYCMKHKKIPSLFTKKTLKYLEENGKIILVQKIDNSPRRKGTFPDNSIITFFKGCQDD